MAKPKLVTVHKLCMFCNHFSYAEGRFRCKRGVYLKGNLNYRTMLVRAENYPGGKPSSAPMPRTAALAEPETDLEFQELMLIAEDCKHYRMRHPAFYALTKLDIDSDDFLNVEVERLVIEKEEDDVK